MDAVAPIPIEVDQAPMHQDMPLVSRWLGALQTAVDQRQLAVTTLETYRRGIRQWVSFLRSREPGPIGPLAVQDFMAAIAALKPATAHSYLAGIRSLYRWIEANELGVDITRSVRPPCLNRMQASIAPTKHQVELLLHHLETRPPRRRRGDLAKFDELIHYRDQALVRMLYGAALRTISLVRGNVADFIPTHHTFMHQAKGRHEKETAVLPATCSATLVHYLALRQDFSVIQLDDPIFTSINPDFGHRLSAAAIRNIVGRAWESAGVKLRVDGNLVQPGVWGPQALRRGSLTITYEKFGIDTAQAIAGHASSDTTKRAYVRVQKHALLTQNAQHLDL